MHVLRALNYFIYRNFCPKRQTSSVVNFKSIESKWAPVIRDHDRTQAQRLDGSSLSERRSYILSMFPYPSGNLHLGHLRVYTVADVLYRYKCMLGYSVLQPMGWDAFGLPAENAAIDRGILPETWTSKNIEQMTAQLQSTMLLGLDWSRELSTCSRDYYRWTQWLFLKLFEAGLVYRRLAFVNWDPVDQTVLADELVDAEGKSWRSGATVERKPLRQWYFRTTVYAESLLAGLEEVADNQWRDVVQMQRGWLGVLDGTQIEVDLVASSDDSPTKSIIDGEKLSLFTKSPGLAVADFIQFIEVTPESVYFDDQFRKSELDRGMNSSRKLLLCSHHSTRSDGSFKLSITSTADSSPWPEVLKVGVRHPFSNRLIPMVRNAHSRGHAGGSVAYPEKLCYPTSDQGVGQLLGLCKPPASVIHESSTSIEDGLLDDCILKTPVSELNGLRVRDSTDTAMRLLKEAKRGGYWTSELRTDWLVSRQRYWGTPIPMVYCPQCGTVPVPVDQLPVTLPHLDRPLKRGDVPLKDNTAWRLTNCPKCGHRAEKETDTLDTFVDSSWYFIRYLDPKNQTQLCDPIKATKDIPVDIYVGGVEHAIRHLYYARFMAHFLYQLGILPCREPFRQFLPVGLILGQTFVEPRTGRYITPAHVSETTDKKGRIAWFEKSSGLPLKMHWDKMSKSKLNGVDPTDVVARHDMELIRLTILANVGPHRARKWQEDGVLQGVSKWRSKLLKLVDGVLEYAQNPSQSSWIVHSGSNDPLQQHVAFYEQHERIIRQIHSYYGETFVISAVIARLQELTDLLRQLSPACGGPGPSSFIYLRALADLVVMLTPIAPMLSCELWSRLQLASTLCDQSTLDAFTSSTHQSSHIFDHWSYDLSRTVLEQPFPVVAQSNSTDTMACATERHEA